MLIAISGISITTNQKILKSVHMGFALYGQDVRDEKTLEVKTHGKKRSKDRKKAYEIPSIN